MFANVTIRKQENYFRSMYEKDIFMINIFNRRRLTADIDVDSISRITQILDENNIEYYQQKFTDNPILPTNITLQRSTKLPIPERKKKKFVYILYIKRKDYAKATALWNCQ